MGCINCRQSLVDLDFSALKSEMFRHGVPQKMISEEIDHTKENGGILCRHCRDEMNRHNRFVDSFDDQTF